MHDPLNNNETPAPGFRGARPLTPEDAAFFRRHREDVARALTRHAQERGEQIRAEIRRLGHDPDNPEPIPDWIIKSISERMALGDFDGPLHITITEEDTRA